MIKSELQDLLANLPENIKQSKDFTTKAKTLLAKLFVLNNRDYSQEHGTFYYTNEKLCKETGISKQGLINIIARFQQLNFISRVKGQRGKATDYILNIEIIKNYGQVPENKVKFNGQVTEEKGQLSNLTIIENLTNEIKRLSLEINELKYFIKVNFENMVKLQSTSNLTTDTDKDTEKEKEILNTSKSQLPVDEKTIEENNINLTNDEDKDEEKTMNSSMKENNTSMDVEFCNNENNSIDEYTNAILNNIKRMNNNNADMVKTNKVEESSSIEEINNASEVTEPVDATENKDDENNINSNESNMTKTNGPVICSDYNDYCYNTSIGVECVYKPKKRLDYDTFKRWTNKVDEYINKYNSSNNAVASDSYDDNIKKAFRWADQHQSEMSEKQWKIVTDKRDYYNRLVDEKTNPNKKHNLQTLKINNAPLPPTAITIDELKKLFDDTTTLNQVQNVHNRYYNTVHKIEVIKLTHAAKDRISKNKAI